MCNDVGLEPLDAIVQRLLAGLEKDQGICAPARQEILRDKERARMTLATRRKTPPTSGSGASAAS